MGLEVLASIGIPIVVKLVDRIFGRGGGKERKLPAALEIVKAIVAKFAAPGVGLPGDDELSGWIQAAVDALNSAGELKGPQTVIDPKLTDATLAAIGVDMIRNGVALLHRAGAIKEAT